MTPCGITMSLVGLAEGVAFAGMVLDVPYLTAAGFTAALVGLLLLLSN